MSTAVENLIAAFAAKWPRKNHIIVVDMSTGTCRVDQMLSLDSPQKEEEDEQEL